MKFKILVLSVVVCFLSCVIVAADQVVLVNGDRLTGTIVKMDEKEVIIKTDYAGIIKLKREAVATIESKQSVSITLKDGRKLNGTVQPENEKVLVKTDDNKSTVASLDDVGTIRSQEEQASYEDEMRRKTSPRFTELWFGTADLGLSATQGNSNNINLTIGVDVERNTQKDKITAYVNAVRTSSNENGSSQTTASAIRFGGRYNYKVNSKSFVFGFTDVEYDKFQRIEPRLVIGGGYGRNIIKNERTAFDLFGGASLKQEFFTDSTKRGRAEMLVGEEWSRKLFANTSLKQKLVFYQVPNRLGERRITLDISAVTQLNRWLGWHTTLSNRYVSNPSPGIKKNDLIFTTGIRTTFGKRN